MIIYVNLILCKRKINSKNPQSVINEVIINKIIIVITIKYIYIILI